MKHALSLNIARYKPSALLFGGLALVIAFSIFGAVILEEYWLAGIPAFLLLLYLTVVDFRKVFFLLIAFLPLSTEIVLPNGFGTDLPSEPLMVGLMLVYLLYSLKKGKNVQVGFLRHPLTLILFFHLGWIAVTSITSSLFLVSFKYLLAKLWYLICFYFLAGSIIKSEKDYKTFFWYFFIPLTLTVLVTLYRHAGYGFSFADVYRVLHPFYRNHVAYAGIMAAFYPIIFLGIAWYSVFSKKWWFLVVFSILLLPAIYLSYTRAAYIALAVAGFAYFTIQLRLIKFIIPVVLAVAIAVVAFLVQGNKYLDYAPNYETTITHTNFDNLIEATYNLEDISTMERFYRWIAGVRMFADQPIVGYGPGNFVNFYRPYTVTGFKTYVSINEENSGIHSYYLMVLVEQGFPGLIIFLVLTSFTLVKGEQIFHTATDPGLKRMAMMSLLCIIVIDVFLIINDTLETDKIGPLYFIALAVLVNVDLKSRIKNAGSAQ